MAYPDNLAFLQATIKALLPNASFAPGGGTSAITQAVATVWDDIQSLIAATSSQMFIGTSKGDYLTAHGLDYNVLRGGGTVGTGTVTFSAPASLSSSNIPPNTQVATPGNGVLATPIIFTTTSNVVIGGGITSVVGNVQSVTVGAANNIPANTITVIRTALPGVSISGSSAITGGTDPTSDTTYRLAIKASLAPSGSANALQLLALAQTTPSNGVSAAYVATGTTAGTLTVYVYDTNNTFLPSPAIADVTLLTQVQNAVMGAVSLGIVTGAATGLFGTIGGITFSPFTVSLLSSFAITYSAPASIQSSYIVPIMQTAITTYVNGLSNGQFPSAFGISNAAQVGAGYVLTYVLVTTALPSSATPTQLYRVAPGITYTWTRQ